MKVKQTRIALFFAACAAILGAQSALADVPTDQKPGSGKQAVKIVKPGEAKGFNPQPEPPGDQGGLTNPGTLKGFNPQPDPPGIGGKQTRQIKQ